MAINNFTSIEVVGRKLVVHGVTRNRPGGPAVDPGEDAKFRVAVIAVDDETKRCELKVANPQVHPWHGESRTGHGFKNFDEVYVVGAATTEQDPLFLWVNRMIVGKPAPER